MTVAMAAAPMTIERDLAGFVGRDQVLPGTTATYEALLPDSLLPALREIP
jgi:hypothetical protein